MTQALGRAASVRVFFALWPGATVRARLDETGRALQAKVGGRLTRAASIHMTLLFIGDVESARVPELAQCAAGVAIEPFTLRVDMVDCWPHNRIAWAGPQATPTALSDLVERLRTAVNDARVAFDRKAFAAHVTLLRNARCGGARETIAPIDWCVRDFVLVRSSVDAGGAAYEVIGRWSAVEAITDAGPEARDA